MYCASATDIDPLYTQTAQQLGAIFAAKNIRLINGGGCIGLMRAMADEVLAHGGQVTGIIPQFMVEQRWHHTRLSKLIVVNSMHERKKTMADLSDGAIALPGGCGTLEELLEIITWKQLGLYRKPIVILNTNNYFDPLLSMFKEAVKQGFMREYHPTLWEVAQTPLEAVNLLLNTPLWNTSIRKIQIQ